MHQCKDYHLQYLPIVLGIVSIISIFTGAGCFLGVALAVLGIVFGFITLKKHPESTKLCYTGIALSLRRSPPYQGKRNLQHLRCPQEP